MHAVFEILKFLKLFALYTHCKPWIRLLLLSLQLLPFYISIIIIIILFIFLRETNRQPTDLRLLWTNKHKIRKKNVSPIINAHSVGSWR